MIKPLEITHQSQNNLKTILVELGQWAIDNGRGWIVREVHAALQQEGLCCE
jgi:hypothetical protein